MTQHNQGMRWVLGALGLLLYMGSFSVTVSKVDAKSQVGIWMLYFLATINNVFIILFDTLVVVATLYNTLGLVKLSRGFQMLPRKSLTQILAEQGLIRYGLSVIIICRCHLALQERVAHPNGTTHSAHHPITSFHAAARHIHNSLMDEFGDPSTEEIGTSEAIEPHREDNPSSEAVTVIELEEIPRGRETAGAVDGDVRAEPRYVAASMGEVSLEV
ncbi:hypothetical protein JB92DRAFT_2826964 [Gautieria morchelliformis]|nr:hypothetical protein JB92DRAFT_2826964 [Gautieria morchelliformis]